MTTFDEAKASWRQIPVDDRGYFDADVLLALSDDVFTAWLDAAEYVRYDEGGYRNWKGGWQRGMHDGLVNRTVLDYGCGIGIESRRLARAGHTVIAADINVSSLAVTHRAVPAVQTVLIAETAPFVDESIDFDVFYCNGVLHHIPYAPDVLAWAASRLPSDGEMRLMVYTDRARDKSNGHMDTTMDFAGVYCDWYDPPKMASIIPHGWKLDRWAYITTDEAYATVRITR